MVKKTDESAENMDLTHADGQKVFLNKSGEGLNESGENIQGGDSFKELYEESLKTIQEGKVVRGEIIQIDNEFVLVDIGYKSEGQIRIAEFIDLQGQLTIKVGDRVDVLLVRKEDKNGRIILSREKVARVKIWDEVEEAYRKHDTIRGKIISQVKGGLSVDLSIPAFLPGSHADLRPIRDLGTLVGMEYDFRVLKYEKHLGNIVLSRRAVLYEERKAHRKEAFDLIEKDAICGGIVTNITHYGLFVDLGGIDGLVHISNISWGRTGHPSEIHQIGDKITVKVLNIDREKERISLGIKQLTPSPRSEAGEKYPE
jgi:small subunit ribosomal protein S1